jgi:hypothetical protein
MPIVESDIKYFLSGASEDEGVQEDPDASLGNYRSSTEVEDATLNNLFDNVSGDEAAAGDTEYRAIFVQNTHATLTWLGVKLWIVAQPDERLTKESFEVGVEPPSEQPDGYIQTIMDESTAPEDVDFSAPANKGAGISIGDLAPGEIYGIWVKRIVPEGAEVKDSAEVQIRCEGDTGE